MDTLAFRPGERLLVAFAVLLFFSGLWSYTHDYPIIRGYLGVHEEKTKIPVGFLVRSRGMIKRQFAGETEFSEIFGRAVIFNNDVVITGPGSEAVLQFDDGSVAQVGAGSMVRLSFVTNLAVKGIQRVGSLEVVAGKVVGQAGKESLVVKSKDQVVTVQGAGAKGIEVVGSGGPNSPSSSVQVVQGTPSALKGVQTDDLPNLTTSSTSAVKPRVAPVVQVEDIIRVTKSPRFEQTPSTASGSILEKKVEMMIDVEPPDAVIQVTVWKISADTEAFQPDQLALREKVTATHGKATLSWIQKSPGKLTWKIQSENSKDLTEARYTHGDLVVTREFENFRPEPPLVAGRVTVSNKVGEKPLSEFEISVKWPKILGAKEYQVWFGKDPDGRSALITKTVETNELTFNKNKILSGDIYYRISTTLENGYVARSGMEKFSFRFLPPILAQPTDRKTISKRSLIEHDQNKVLLTWEITNFTKKYEVEISEDPDFISPLLKKGVEENYYWFNDPAPGQYWWRVRSVGSNTVSLMSPAQTFTIQP